MDKNNLPSMDDYRNMSRSERLALFNSGRNKRVAEAKIRAENAPSKSADEALLAQVEQQIKHLTRKGVTNTSLLEDKAAMLRDRIAVDADMQARQTSEQGVAANEAFDRYRQFLVDNAASQQTLAEHDAAVTVYWENQGDGDFMKEDFQAAMKTYAVHRLAVEDAISAKVRDQELAVENSKAGLEQEQARLKALQSESEESDGESQ